MSLIKTSNGIFTNINSKLLKIAEFTCFEFERDIKSKRVTTIYKIRKILFDQDVKGRDTKQYQHVVLPSLSNI